jgi:hypothetical protein
MTADTGTPRTTSEVRIYNQRVLRLDATAVPHHSSNSCMPHTVSLNCMHEQKYPHSCDGWRERVSRSKSALKRVKRCVLTRIVCPASFRAPPSAVPCGVGGGHSGASGCSASTTFQHWLCCCARTPAMHRPVRALEPCHQCHTRQC